MLRELCVTTLFFFIISCGTNLETSSKRKDQPAMSMDDANGDQMIASETGDESKVFIPDNKAETFQQEGTEESNIATDTTSSYLGISPNTKIEIASSSFYLSVPDGLTDQQLLELSVGLQYEESKTMPKEALVVFYHITNSDGKEALGLIPSKLLTKSENSINFVPKGTGYYQAAYLNPAVEEALEKLVTPVNSATQQAIVLNEQSEAEFSQLVDPTTISQVGSNIFVPDDGRYGNSDNNVFVIDVSDEKSPKLLAKNECTYQSSNNDSLIINDTIYFGLNNGQLSACSLALETASKVGTKTTEEYLYFNTYAYDAGNLFRVISNGVETVPVRPWIFPSYRGIRSIASGDSNKIFVAKDRAGVGIVDVSGPSWVTVGHIVTTYQVEQIEVGKSIAVALGEQNYTVFEVKRDDSGHIIKVIESSTGSIKDSVFVSLAIDDDKAVATTTENGEVKIYTFRNSEVKSQLIGRYVADPKQIVLAHDRAFILAEVKDNKGGDEENYQVDVINLKDANTPYVETSFQLAEEYDQLIVEDDLITLMRPKKIKLIGLTVGD